MNKIKKLVAIAFSMILIVTIILIFAISSKAADQNRMEEKNISGYLSGVEITKPKEGYLYVFDREIAPIGITLVLGKITIEVETVENVSGVDIYIDDVLKFSDFTYPFSRLWNERATGRHVIRAVEHGGDESDEVSVLIFNFVKTKSGVMINEIMSDPKGSDAGKEWIELYNKGERIKIKGWTISNADGNAIATLPNWIFPNDTYLVVNFGSGTNDNDFSDGNGTFYVGSNQEFLDNNMDECALYTGEPSENTIIDFVAYCYEGNYTSGTAYDYATKAGIWNDGEYFNPAINIPASSKVPVVSEGGSIGRDSYSNDTNMPEDWSVTGGKDAFEPSPGRCNLNVFGMVDMRMPSHLLTSSKIKKWTVMVYMGWDNNLETLCWQQLNWLEKVGTDSNINIVFLVDGKSKILETKVVNGIMQNVESTKGKTFRGFLMKDNKTGWVNWPTRHTRIRASSLIWVYNKNTDPICIGEQNTGTAPLLNAFIDWAVDVAPAEHYILLLNSHGNGWKGLLPDDTNNDRLYMYELRDALANSNIFTLDILGFDACLMAMIEVGYQVHLEVDNMVASEERILTPGWNYSDIFSKLQKNPSMTPEELAGNIVDSYHKMHIKDDAKHTLSAVRLNNDFVKLFKKVGEFGEQLKRGIEDWGDDENHFFKVNGNPGDNCQVDIKNTVIKESEFYEDNNFIDLYHFADRIGKNNGIYNGYKDKWMDITNLAKKVVIKEAHGTKHANSHGISIYFPSNQAKFTKHENPFDYPWPSHLKDKNPPLAIYAYDYTTEWGKVPPNHPYLETPNFLFREGKWDEFLHRYYKPCADAGPDQSFEIGANESDVLVNFDGAGSSDTDGVIKKYYWDFNDKVSSDNGDWDKDRVDETNDDKDAENKTVTHRFTPGRYVVTLTVWDDHYLLSDARTNSVPKTHYKTDQDTCIIVVTKKINDTTPPTIIITNPPNGIEVNEDSINVTGIAKDDIGIVEFGYHLKWKDGEASDSWELDNLTSYEFEFEVELHEDWNEITVWAKDYAGNEGNDSVTVWYYPEEDTTPPITTEEVGQPSSEGGYQVTPGTPIWLNATDDMSGVNYIYYEVWWDSDGDGVIETKMGEETAYTSNVEFCFADYEIYTEVAELRFYAVDNAGNIEEMKIKQHLVQEG